MITRCVILASVFLALAALRATAQASEGDPLVEKGAALYRANCQACHGADPSQPAPGVKNLREFAGDEKAFAAVVKNGRNAMPPHPGLTDDDFAALYAYVKSE